ncbi:MAG TPA: SRPBCC domain-containing protein [Acidimicrobiia bacterium]|nr:SRPBCC domain-containing protein [Acidimicrobiia bacterium]
MELHEEPKVVRRIEIELGPDRVWEIVTGALGDWLGGDIEIDLRPGGKIDFSATQRREGVVEEYEPGRRLVWRWWEAGDQDGATDTVVELVIGEANRGSLLTITETRSPAWTWELIETTWIDPPSSHPGGILALAR